MAWGGARTAQKVQALEERGIHAFVKQHAPTSEAFRSRQTTVPLHQTYVDWQLANAVENLRDLHRLAATPGI
ncbi:MAG: hypothetical protein JXR37_33560 [Kiritimatiellae bacterium]|nr:hypothetical protein [Kiritimatiellia bacterium]